MDILAHALWAGAGIKLAQRHVHIERRIVVATIALAVLPDFFQMIPIAGWTLFGSGTLATVLDYIFAMPEHRPALPPAVTFFSHHLHCIAHSAIIAGAVSVAVLIVTRALWIPLLGWWSHIIIDVPTHSAEYDPSPVLYPITLRGFDGVAWMEPWFMALNYLALGICWWWIRRYADSR